MKLILPLLTILLLCWPQSGIALCVTAKVANLRAGPGTKYENTRTVGPLMPLQELGRKGKWIRVKDVDGDIYWIHRNLVTKKHLCATVKVDDANVRKKPNGPKAYDFPVIKYTNFRVLKRKGKWVEVKDPIAGDVWIFGELVWVQ